ncbi:hexose transporter [Monoraphidium neglectum]|uniref:Hexose transporter n=1 Tax=Monoraphidium neglectum TaxID=145388 RepID=A0A0D2LZQ7_9CHLO|nr:hexose transporter [Monoraphidium neglectum]KIY94836.1 hexose transporter [Monoraphidium neglectum]|eukprot:XP_013893856.1 hexose transporter [Monoraphidium neglectum]
MLIMAAGFVLPALSAYAGPIALGGTLFYILSFAIGAGPVSGLIVPELNDACVRGLQRGAAVLQQGRKASNAVSAAMVTHWVCNVAIGQNFMAWVDRFGLSAVYTGFALASLIGAAYIQANVPETKGKSFGEIQKELNA